MPSRLFSPQIEPIRSLQARESLVSVASKRNATEHSDGESSWWGSALDEVIEESGAASDLHTTRFPDCVEDVLCGSDQPWTCSSRWVEGWSQDKLCSGTRKAGMGENGFSMGRSASGVECSDYGVATMSDSQDPYRWVHCIYNVNSTYSYIVRTILKVTTLSWLYHLCAHFIHKYAYFLRNGVQYILYTTSQNIFRFYVFVLSTLTSYHIHYTLHVCIILRCLRPLCWGWPVQQHVTSWPRWHVEVIFNTMAALCPATWSRSED